MVSMVKGVLWQSPKTNVTRSSFELSSYQMFGDYSFKTTCTTFPMGNGVKQIIVCFSVDPNYPDYLQEAEVSVMADEECVEAAAEKYADSHVCVHGQDYSSCQVTIPTPTEKYADSHVCVHGQDYSSCQVAIPTPIKRYADSHVCARPGLLQLMSGNHPHPHREVCWQSCVCARPELQLMPGNHPHPYKEVCWQSCVCTTRTTTAHVR